MPRVVPSRVVDLINTLWPTADRQKDINAAQAGLLSGLVELADQIPPELLTMDSALYASFICAKAHIRHSLLVWTSEPRQPNWLGSMPGQPEQIPVTVIRQALVQCPDESPAPGTSELNFIPDEKLRTNLRNDIGAVHQALANGEWKAATVLGGSVIEALLFWALQQRPQTEITNISPAAPKLPTKDLDKWDLADYIEAAKRLKIISDVTATQALLAKDFRNFIHPGRELRFGQKCNRATAHSAVAGMEHVITNLTP